MSSTTTLIDGKEYIPSKHASEITGYTQDYIGQLARAGTIDAQRVGGLWHVHLPSILAHKEKAESYVPVPPAKPSIQQTSVDNVLSLDGKTYVSSARASALTGYTQDYIGQLAREGKVTSRQIGARWYVNQEGIVAHKQEKDALLAAVQAESVGLGATRAQETPKTTAAEEEQAHEEPFYSYSRDTRPLMPGVSNTVATESVISATQKTSTSPIPIRVHQTWDQAHDNVSEYGYRSPQHVTRPVYRAKNKARTLGPLAITTLVALTVVAVVGVGLYRFSFGGVLTKAISLPSTDTATLTANVFSALDIIGDFLESLLGTEQIYIR